MNEGCTVWLINTDCLIGKDSKGGLGWDAKMTQQANGLTGERARCPDGVFAGRPGGEGVQDSLRESDNGMGRCAK